MRREKSTMSEWTRVLSELLRAPDDLSLWEKLVGLVLPLKLSSADEKAMARAAYDQMLARFPLLTNYWKKYAEMEVQLGDTTRAAQVYRTGLRHLPYCLDLWLSYLHHKIETLTDNVDEIVGLFEEARTRIGHHYYAYEFYKLYLDFLDAYNKHQEYYVLLRIVVEVPLFHYAYFFRLLFAAIARCAKEPKMVEWLVPQSSRRRDDRPIEVAVKKHFVDVYITTQFAVFEMYPLEKELINYWDQKPRSQQQLAAWERYCDFIELRYPSMARLAHERAVEATARYPDGWLRYARYLRRHGFRTELVLHRAVAHCANHRVVMALVDALVGARQASRARDVVVNYIAHLAYVPFEVYEKLLNLEYGAERDSLYFLSVVAEVIAVTKLDYWFQHVLNYQLDEGERTKFFDAHKAEYGESIGYKQAQTWLEPATTPRDYGRIVNYI